MGQLRRVAEEQAVAQAANDERLKRKRQLQEESTLSPVQAKEIIGTLARAVARHLRIMMRC